MQLETVHVKHPLSDDDRIRIGKLLAEKTAEVIDLQDEKKSVAANFTDRIKAAELILTRCSKSLREGYEMKPTEVTLKPNYESGEMVFIARSTGEEVGRRELSPEERQLRIDDIDEY